MASQSGGQVNMLDLLQRLEKGAGDLSNVNAVNNLISQKYGNNELAKTLVTRDIYGSSIQTARNGFGGQLTPGAMGTELDPSIPAHVTNRIAKENMVLSKEGQMASDARQAVESTMIKLAQGMVTGINDLVKKFEDIYNNGLTIKLPFGQTLELFEGKNKKPPTVSSGTNP